MSDDAARSFRQRMADDAQLRDRVRAACTRQHDFDLPGLARELGYAVTRVELLRLWAELASRGELSEFELELNTRIKHYPHAGDFAWMSHELAKNMGEPREPIEVAVDHDALAIAVITAPRRPATLNSTLASLRSAGFPQEIHVFAEPKTLRLGWAFPGVRLHQNEQRLGLYPNWLNAARWLLNETDKQWMLLCEDDVELNPSAGAGLWHGLTTLESVGYVSLYTSVRAAELSEVELRPGWVAISLGRLNWGALAYGFPRAVLTEIVRREVAPDQESTDSHVAEHLRQMGLNCWHHLPSLARHTGNENSSVGHPNRTGYATVGYRSSYFGFRDTGAPAPANIPRTDLKASVPHVPAKLPGELWGLIAHYNPAGYANKLRNLDSCVRRARAQGLKLLIVELAFRNAPFEVPEDLCDRIVRRRTDSILWQKERLLNIGLRQLPASCDKVVWLDGDVLFENDNWVEETAVLLQTFMVVQPFDTACWLAPGEMRRTLEPNGGGQTRAMPGFAYVISGLGEHRELMPDYYRQGHTGFAWAARRALMDKHGFHDVQILGGGDAIMAQAMYGIEDAFSKSHPLSQRYPGAAARHIEKWSRQFHHDVGASVYFVPGRVLHLWHGDLADRNYIERHAILREHDFDPSADLRLDADECWAWASDKLQLQQQVATYFLARKEEARDASDG
ncbi:MAG TPA: Nif11-like leader peptide family natural product precursor [Terriglobales bacterium]|nr:Nif11-like leader peptide family natural product precursor [Terriglobales bacterium]